MKKRGWIGLGVWLLTGCFALSVSAGVTPYANYSYDFWGNPVEMPACYTPAAVCLGRETGAGDFKAPQDLFVDSRRQIYVADTGNNRLVILDEELRLVSSIDHLVLDESQQEIVPTFQKPSGVFVSEDGTIFLADTENKRVVAMDRAGRLLREFVKPSGDVNYTALDFLPTKVVADKTGFVYVVSKNTYQGLILYRPDGTFAGYHAANDTEVTFELLMDYFWKNLLTDEQRSQMANYVSIEYSSVDIDDKGFIYATTLMTQTDTKQISKINPSGDNVMQYSTAIHPDFEQRFGDLGTAQLQGVTMKTKFVDICYDESGFVNALDYQRGRVFQYSDEGDLITVFGGIGNQTGTLKAPAAIDMLDTRILVLDSGKNNITVFERSPFGQQIQEAVTAHREGRYTEVRERWEQILARDSNYTLARIGIGKACYEEGDYQTAMQYFRSGEDRSNYGKAFKKQRDGVLRNLIPVVCVAAAVLLFGGRAVGRIRRRRAARKAETGRERS